jgi:GxxExxY protein
MTRIELLEENLTHSIIGAFFEVYNTLGFGFLEHIYVLALERELIARGHRVSRQVGVVV